MTDITPALAVLAASRDGRLGRDREVRRLVALALASLLAAVGSVVVMAQCG